MDLSAEMIPYWKRHRERYASPLSPLVVMMVLQYMQVCLVNT